MLTYTVYSEAGGVGKTTLAATLATAHAEHGRDVLALDLDPQDGSLTYLLGVDAPRDDDDADNIARHLINQPAGAFDGLVEETDYGFDLVPNHGMLENLTTLLSRAEEMATELNQDFEPLDQLRQILIDADVPDYYDTILVDPPATAGPHLYNGVAATHSLVIPVEPTGKGMASIDGLDGLVGGLEGQLDIDVGVLAVVPNGVGNTSDQDKYLQEIGHLGFDAPVAIAERSSLFDGCWNTHCPPQYYVRNHRSAYDYEQETLAKLDDLATHLEEVGS